MISVIVPVYNAEKYLHRCVDSILSQTYTDLELLLIDDGATDRSGQICDEYATRDSRVHVFHKDNGGVSSTRNFGLSLAQGEWITFVDSDDWIEPDVYERVLKHAIEVNADICCYDFKIIYPDKVEYLCTPEISTTKEAFLNRWLRYDLTSLCAMLVKKDIYERHHLRCPISNYCEDFHLTTRLLFYAKKITKISYCGYNYNRLNESSLVNNLSEKAAKEELVVYQEILEFFQENEVVEKFEEAIVWRILKCTQHLILDSNRCAEFKKVFPSTYGEYIGSAPPRYVNKKIKIMAWLLCHNLDGIVASFNYLRRLLRR